MPAKVQTVCNVAPIKYGRAGQSIDPLGYVQADVKRLRDLGLSLVQISNLLERALSVDHLA